jgi:hypothetical protein
MAVSSVRLRLKCDCFGKAQKQLYSKLQTRFLVREDALIAKRRNCQTKEEDQDKIWSRIPKGGPIPRRTGRLTVGRKKNSNSKVFEHVLVTPQKPYLQNASSRHGYSFLIGLCILLRVYQSISIETSVRKKCWCTVWCAFFHDILQTT